MLDRWQQDQAADVLYRLRARCGMASATWGFEKKEVTVSC